MVTEKVLEEQLLKKQVITMDNIEELVKLVTQKVLEKLGEVPEIFDDLAKQIKVYGKKTEELALFLKEHDYVEGASIEASSGVVLTELTLERLIGISNMLPTTDEDREILDALLNKKPVFVLNGAKEYATLLQDSPYGMKAHVKSCEEQWVRFGAQFITIETKSTKTKTTSKAWTMEYLQKEVAKGVTVFEAEKGTIITPLAKDYIREQQLQLNYARKEE